jgi:hypothetical protein
VPTTKPRDGWVMTGMAVAATSAAVASFTGLRGLALVAGWPDRLAWLLPITIDAYAMTSARVWLAPTSHTRRARRFAQANAIGAIATSIVGNAAYHAVSVRLLTVSWPIVVIVGAVPAAVLGLTAHLHALRTIDRDSPGPNVTEDGTENRAESEPETGQESGPEDGTQDRTESGTERRSPTRTRSRSRRRAKSRTEDELIAAARTADAEYRAAHDGRPITRDELRAALRIAGPKATELRRRLAAEPAEPTAEDTDRKEAYATT